MSLLLKHYEMNLVAYVGKSQTASLERASKGMY